jgi:hypothetical protein
MHTRLWLAVATVAACRHSYDTITYENPIRPATEDDAAPASIVEDPALEYDGPRGRENRSATRYRFDVAAFDDEAQRDEAARLYPSHAAYLRAHAGALPSVQTVVTYAKQLDDTIVAGVQEAMEAELAAKRAVVDETLAELLAHGGADADDAIALLAAASRAVAGDPKLPPALAEKSLRVERDFDTDAMRSRPIGFYTWSSELRAIWKRDRLLQTPLPAMAACAAARAIAAVPARLAKYRTIVAVQARLTNPQQTTLLELVPLAAGPECGKQQPHAFLGASRSIEEALYDKLYPQGPPADAELMRDFIAAVRGGLDLAPKPGDGWYQYQQYALQTLLVTDRAEERAKIAFTARYKKRLAEAFATLMTQHRETHVESFGGFKMGAAVPRSRVPEFAVEPLATVYVRHARSYVFLEHALDEILGSDALDRTPAVGADGPQPDTLRARIRRARELYFGVYLVACQELGMHPHLDAAGDPTDEQRAQLASDARHWLAELANDPVAAADVRVAVPIAAIDRSHAKYWVVIGVHTTLAAYSYVDGDDDGVPSRDKQARLALPTEQFLEVVSSTTPPTREELRALCDQYKTPSAIKAALERRVTN